MELRKRSKQRWQFEGTKKVQRKSDSEGWKLGSGKSEGLPPRG